MGSFDDLPLDPNMPLSFSKLETLVPELPALDEKAIKIEKDLTPLLSLNPSQLLAKKDLILDCKKRIADIHITLLPKEAFSEAYELVENLQRGLEKSDARIPQLSTIIPNLSVGDSVIIDVRVKKEKGKVYLTLLEKDRGFYRVQCCGNFHTPKGSTEFNTTLVFDKEHSLSFVESLDLNHTEKQAIEEQKRVCGDDVFVIVPEEQTYFCKCHIEGQFVLP